MRTRIGAALLALGLTGCAGSIGELSLVSNQDSLPVSVEVLQRDVTSRRCRWEWQQGQNPTVEEVVSRALVQVPGANALANVSIQPTTYPFSMLLVLVDRRCLTLRGEAVRIGTP